MGKAKAAKTRRISFGFSKKPRADVKAVIVSGDGIREGQVGKTAVFTIDASAAGPGDLDVKVRGPKNPIDVTPVEIGDGLYEVSYTPSEEGSHIIAVKYADQHVPGSAFSVDVIDDRSDPITYQMTEMQSASEPLPLARWPNTFLKTPEEELEEIPEASGVIPEEETEEPQKPSSSSSSSSSYTSTATLIARENEARRAAFERQWNSYLARSPSPEPPQAHRVSTEEEDEEEEEKEEEEESRMTPDQSHNLMTYDSHVQGQLDLVDDAYDEVTRTYYDSHAADSPLEKKSSSSSSDTARSTVKDESPPMRTLEDYLSKISTSSSSSQKSSFVLVEKQPEVTESDIYYKIATEPVLPRAPSPMSSDTDTSSHSRKALEKRIARRRELSRQWSEQYFPTTSSLLNPVVFRESTVEDHTRSSKPVSLTPRKIDVPREKSSSSSSEHDETFTNKLHFFRRNSISSAAPLPTYSQRTASSLPSIHSRRPIVSPERPDIPPRTPITPDRYSPSPSPEPAVTPEKSLTSEKSPSPSRNSFNLSTLLAKVTDDKSKSSSSSSESIVLPKPVKTCSIGVQADLIETCSYNCKSKEKSMQEKGVQKEDSQKVSEKMEVKENKTKRNGEETKAEPEKEKTQSIPDDTKSTWPAFDINLPKFGGEKEPEPEVLIDWKYKPARKKSEVEYRRWNLKSPTPEREQQEPIVEEKVDRHSDNDKKFTFPNFDINLPSFKREERSPSVSEKEEKVETKAKEPAKEGQEESKKFELNFPNFEINLPTFKKEEKSPTTPEQEDGIKKEADDESAEKRPEDEKRFDLNFPKFDIDLPKFSRDSESNKPASPEKRESSKEKKDDERNDKQSDSLFRLPSMELNFWKSEDNPKENLKSDEKEVNWVYKPKKGSDSPTEKRWRKEQSEESSSSSYESSSSETPPPRPPKSPGRRKPQLLRRDSSFGTELERQQYLREIRNRPKVYNEDIKNSKNAYERETGIGRHNEDDGEKNKWHDLTASERAELLDKQLRKGRDLDKAREEVKPGPKKHSSLPRMSSGNVNRWGGTYPEEERPRTLERRKSVVEDRIEQIFNKSEVSSEARSPSPVRWNFVRNTVYRRTDGSIPEPKKDNYAELRSTSPIIVGSSNGYKVKEKKPEKKPGKIPERKPESAKPKKQHPIVEPEKPRKTSTWAQEWAQKRNLLVTNEPSSSSSSSESYEEYYVKKFPKSTPVKRTKPPAEPVHKQMADPKPILKSSKSKDPIRSQPISPVYRVQVREKTPEEKRSNPKSKKGTKNRKGNGRRRKKYSSSSSSSYSYNSSDSDTSTPTSYFPKSSKKQPPPKLSPSPVTPPPPLPSKNELNSNRSESYRRPTSPVIPPPPLPSKNDLNSNRSESYRRPRSRSRISADDSWIKNNFDDHDESVMYEQNLPEDLQPWYGRK